jgi:hypothetical protein
MPGRWGAPNGETGALSEFRGPLPLTAPAPHDIERQGNTSQHEERELLHLHGASFHRLETSTPLT